MRKAQHNKLLLNVIIAALKGSLYETIDTSKDEKVNFQYILGQSIRQWQIPKSNWHISKAAHKVWEMITKDDIHYRDYKESFECTCNPPVNVPTFSGTTRDFNSIIHKELTSKHIVRGKIVEGNKYVYNDIFITEHTTPVSDIILALKECYRSNESNNTMQKLRDECIVILNKIHKTQMLKIEDRRIDSCQKRLDLVKGRKSYYTYMLNTDSQKIYKQIKRKCYKTPILRDIGLEFYNEVEALKVKKWASALTLDKPYKIEIIPNNQK